MRTGSNEASAALINGETEREADKGDALELLLDVLAPDSTRLARDLSSPHLPRSEKQQQATRALLQAASSGNADLLEWLFAGNKGHESAAYCDIDAVDEDGYPALVLATVFGHTDAVRVLCDAGVDINARDLRGWTALMWAFQTGSKF